MQRLALAALAVLLAAAMVDARMPRNEEERQRMEHHEQMRKMKEAHHHTYFVLIKPESENKKNELHRTQNLAQLFKERLGNDKHVQITTASKDKLVLHIKGEKTLAGEVVNAVKAFKETAHVEQKPTFRTLGGRPMPRPSKTATM
mmetsp:Transcript_25066/g.39365  ORF Transcript_25066/g.39365 Transcript_25066/m.39365 type:complete len:145 (+) Transcript_25066:43-477(+)|eukprot:CAMPEP_0184296628 /NCGR_PEP_ID=MMETSP1049-20130417/7593_1 /TAXON_ID=77928 /ORGANISM="Proteomonas sulcata, Strain CCMP704" /LENGTH=144 /DNA_ID=CAMNT_0026605959 /DNA_START=94 /DNA_END=528 /DNA_ORIENTATION=-